MGNDMKSASEVSVLSYWIYIFSFTLKQIIPKLLKLSESNPTLNEASVCMRDSYFSKQIQLRKNWLEGSK